MRCVRLAGSTALAARRGAVRASPASTSARGRAPSRPASSSASRLAVAFAASAQKVATKPPSRVARAMALQ